MSLNLKDRKAYREDVNVEHKKLAKADREDLIQRYLPVDEARGNSASQDKSRLGVRKFVKSQLFVILYVLIHAIFSVCIRIRIACHTVSLRITSILNHHHKTPDYVRKDISVLGRVPKHVSIILTLENGGRAGDAVEKLINEVSEVAAWCASAGIGNLSVYEKTGALKRYMPQVHRATSQKLTDWFGKYHAPSLSLHARGFPTIQPQNQNTNLGLMLISADDGRGAMVDLTKVFAQMVQKNKITTADITSDVIDNELTEAVMAEPDLLISFEPYVDLQGYPPWQMRLTEIYCAQDIQGVAYQVFIRGLHKYAEATFKLGK